MARQLSQHFSLEELTRSNAAMRAGVANVPPPAIVDRLTLLADRLEGIRRICGGRVITVFSGYRSPAVNKLVGGAATSSHLDGDAADIKVAGLDIAETVAMIRAAPGFKYDQIIDEFSSWVHVGFGPRMRQQVLKARKVGGKTVYSPM